MAQVFMASVIQRDGATYVWPHVSTDMGNRALRDVVVVTHATGLVAALKQAERAVEETTALEPQRRAYDDGAALARAAGYPTIEEFVKGSVACWVHCIDDATTIVLLAPDDGGFVSQGAPVSLPSGSSMEAVARAVEKTLARGK